MPKHFEDVLNALIETNQHEFRDEQFNCYFIVRVNHDGTPEVISHTQYMQAYETRM